MANLKTSLVCTVLNEEKTIEEFINSIVKQSVLPNEIIIVDGGSSDGTVANIKYKISRLRQGFGGQAKLKDYRIKFKVFIKKGNRSVGRNEGIKRASSETILITDSGCILDKDWIKNITKPFNDKNTDVVAGYYKGESKNIFQKSLIPYVLVMPDKINEKEFLPATRSMAFKKSIWKKAGGFDEKLSHNEDYAFANKLKEINAKIVFAKDAIVNWIPRKNLKQAFVMFFRFAFGDIQANLVRDKVVYLFLRYIFAAYLLALAVVMKSVFLNLFIILALFGYILWSIFKNYKYVNDIKAFLYLPLLQFTSDFAILTGTTIGAIRKFSFNKIFKIILNNKGVFLVILVYILSMLSVINYGIPNSNHPFNYFMDEWHQSQSVRNLFKYGTPNIAGSANGSIFHFFLTGIYLIPFQILGVINLFAIKSSVINLDLQFRLFEILRLNTLLFGILSIILVAYISKKYFKLNPFIVSFLFTFNPLWITLSNYFKYDIALMFWILLSFLFMLKYIKNNTVINFLFACIFSAISLSVKLEPFNLLLMLLIIFFLFTIQIKKNINVLFLGMFSYITVFMLFGIPDIILGKGSLNEYLSSNLSTVPDATSNIFKLGTSFWIYFIQTLYPVSFGRIFYLLFLLSISASIIYLLKFVIIKRMKIKQIVYDNKFIATLLLAIFSYVIILIPLRIGALSNRLIPLLPFMAILIVLVGTHTYNYIKIKNLKVIFIFITLTLLVIQIIETNSWNTLKSHSNPRSVSSRWIIENIKLNTVIGVENIPIYQMLPDIIVKEFYLKQYGRGQDNKYIYEIISSKNKNFPNTIIISNDYMEENYLVKSDKKIIIQKLTNQNYKKTKVFTLQSKYFYMFNSRLEYYMSALIQLPDTISIYEKL